MKIPSHLSFITGDNSPRARAGRRNQRGFTLIEILVSVGIIVLLLGLALPAILMSRKRGIEIRIKSDITLIGTALTAYRDAFGQYPQFADPTTDQAVTVTQTPGNGLWLDIQSGGCRGATLLCRALIGPGSADTSTSSGTGFPANPGDDGADGPGFRVRHISAGTNANGTPILAGSVYGPYLDPSKFKIQYVTPSGNSVIGSFPKAYPVICDILGNPILYYPAASGNAPSILGYMNPLIATATTGNAPFRFNEYDNYYFFSDTTSATSDTTNTTSFDQLAADCGSLPYLLWTAGSDGQFGLIKGKSDDLTNFDLPANLKK